MADPAVPGGAVYSTPPQYAAHGAGAPSAPVPETGSSIAPVHEPYRPASTEYGTPSSPTTGAYGPGTYAAERGVPTSSAPDACSPAGYFPGDYASRAYAPAGYAPGGYVPGAYAPAGYAPASYVPGAYAPGTYPPASTSPGGLPPEGSVHGSNVPPPAESGAPAPASSVPGSSEPGSTTPVPLAPGVAVPYRDQGAANPVAPGTTNCPPGLEYLALIEQVVVQQQVELTEAFLGCETCNVYEAKNSLGQLTYTIKENSSCCARCCCGPRRCLEIDVYDYMKTVVMHIVRPLRCGHCCCFCCLQKMEVQAPPGTTIAFVRQRWSVCHPYFTVYTPEDEAALDIVGPVCTESVPCKCDVKFKVRSMNGVTIGRITKEWGGLVKEYFTDADTFNLDFPLDLDVRMKAALMASAMLIDYMFFEEAFKQKGDRAPGMAG